MAKMQKLEGMTPTQVVDALGRYIMGQEDARKAVAVAVRNRARRRMVPDEIRDEIAPKNIIMIGPTGVGKTEIARRLSALTGAPFIKVEATKYTEVGYVGRDVESMIRDLATTAITLVKREHQKEVQLKAAKAAEDILLDILFPVSVSGGRGSSENSDEQERVFNTTREKMQKKLQNGELEEKTVEIEVESGNSGPVFDVLASSGLEGMDINFQEMLSNIMPQRTRSRKMRVEEARRVLMQQEMEKLIDMERVTEEALHRVEEMGIVFIDEIDKIAGRESRQGPDVSREGVQRDILPIIEGCTVKTRYGPVKTDHILFIAAGAFYVNQPADLIPELQGRFPIRVQLSPLSHADFKRILTRPRNALIKQYQALMLTEGVELKFDNSGIDEIARIAEDYNNRTENIGARRLHTLMERLLEDLSFRAPEMQGETLLINRAYVKEKLSGLLEHRDVSSYIL